MGCVCIFGRWVFGSQRVKELLPVSLSPQHNKTLEQIGQESPEMMRHLITMFEEQAPVLITAIKTHITSQNNEEQRKTAHALKGVCLNLGLEPMGEVCKRLELAYKEPKERQLHLLQELEHSFTRTMAQLHMLVQRFN